MGARRPRGRWQLKTPNPDRTAHQGSAALVVAALILSAHWYLGRPDAVAALSTSGDWMVLTAQELPAVQSFLVALVVLGAVPALLAPWLVGKSATRLGLTAGQWRRGLTLVAVGVPIAVLAGFIGAGDRGLAAIHPLGGTAQYRSSPAAYLGSYLLYYLGFEYFFRGFLLLGLAESLGRGRANAIQAALATTLHFGRAAAETFAALPASLLFGWITLRTGSIWYSTVLHWTVGASLVWFLGR